MKLLFISLNINRFRGSNSPLTVIPIKSRTVLRKSVLLTMVLLSMQLEYGFSQITLSINNVEPNNTLYLDACPRSLFVNASMDVSGIVKVSIDLFHNGIKIGSDQNRYYGIVGSIIWFEFYIKPLPGRYHAVIKRGKSTIVSPPIYVESAHHNPLTQGLPYFESETAITNVNGGGDDLVICSIEKNDIALQTVDLTRKVGISSLAYNVLGAGFNEETDKTFIANVNGGPSDLVILNTGGSGTAIRVIDLITMNDIATMDYNTLGQGIAEPEDKAFIANVNGGADDLVLVNTGGSGIAIRVIDLSTMRDIATMDYNTLGQGIAEPEDKAFIANVNGGADDLVLVNTGGSGIAIRVIDLSTMRDIATMDYNTLGQGIAEPEDKAFIANVNGGADDLVLVNTGGSGIAIRVIDLSTMKDIVTMDYNTLGQGIAEPEDKALIANVNGGADDLVLVNTGGSGIAIRVIDLSTMRDITTMDYNTLGQGIAEPEDKALIANVNGGADDLVLINTGGSKTAIRVIDLSTMRNISIIDYCRN